MNYLLMIDDKFTDNIAGVYASLMPKERYERFMQTKDVLHRKQIVAAYLLLCFALGHETSFKSARLAFCYSANGKPYLLDDQTVNFSLSHSSEYILCSISKTNVGNDIEKKIEGVSVDFVEAESLYKLWDGMQLKDNCLSSKTHVIFGGGYIAAVSGTEISETIMEVALSDVLAYVSELTTIGAYLSLNHECSRKEYPTPLTLFKDCVAKYPQREAVSYKGKSITYSELDAFSDKMARRLVSVGVKRGDNVILAVGVAIEFSIAEFAIMKVGATYVPVYKRWPLERINYIIDVCGAKTLITDKTGMFSSAEIENVVVCEDYDTGFDDGSIVEVGEDLNDVAYIVFTSGSSGHPKGVMVTKRNLAAFSYKDIGSYYDTVVQTNSLRVACICTLSFDMSIAENTSTLLMGGTVVFADEEDQLPERFGEFLLNNKVDLIWATPSKFKMYLNTESCRNALNTLQTVVVAGEILDSETVGLSVEYKFSLFNMYGPTETTIVSTCYRVEKVEQAVPIGRPLVNEQCYILNSGGRLCELGERGELCIAGACVSSGYIRNEQLTKRSFTDNPFGCGTLYHTGDVASLEIDGNIRFYGRLDNQVKINGFRVELEEIENVIGHLTNKKTVVLYNRSQLIAVVESDNVLTDIESRLQSTLPNYMLPSVFYYVVPFPTSANGKIDRKALLEMVGKHEKAAFAPPETDLQSSIVTIWQDYFNAKEIGIDDNFSLLGGDSIDAMRISAILKNVGIDVSSHDIIRCKTPRTIADLIEKRICKKIQIRKNFADLTVYLAPKSQEICTEYLASYQSNFKGGSLCKKYRPLKMHREIMTSTSSCNQMIYSVDGTTDINKIKVAVKELIAANAAFRTTYSIATNECLEHPFSKDWNIPVLKLSNVNSKLAKAIPTVSIRDGVQYLSYIFLAADSANKIYLCIYLHWRFCDKAAQDLIEMQLNAFANDEQMDIAGFTDPSYYATFIQKNKLEFTTHISEDARQYLQEFATLSADTSINSIVLNAKNNHYICSLSLNADLYDEYCRNPFDFFVGVYGVILQKIFDSCSIPIFCIEHNRNGANEWLIDSVIDFYPLIVGKDKSGYFETVKELRSYKRVNEMFVENSTWNNCAKLLPFINYVADSENGDSNEVELRKTANFNIIEEAQVNDNISCSVFKKEGRLVFVFNVPLSHEELSCALKEVIKMPRN